MNKKLKPLFILSALVLLIVGMGCTTADTLALETTNLSAESAPITEDDEPEDFEEIEAPAELIPGYLPEGYQPAEAFLLDAAEFEEDAIWYIPEKGTATWVEFWGPGDEDFLDVTASESPYASLDLWIAEIQAMEFEYEKDFSEAEEGEEADDADQADSEAYDEEEYSFEDEIVSIKNVDVLLEDWTDEYGAYSVATFIVDGQFIVVEGTLSAEELTKVVESLPVLP